MTIRASRRRRSLAAVLLSIALGTAISAAPATAGPGKGKHDAADRPAFTLTVLHSNDMESQLLGIDADIDGDGDITPEEERAFGGVARFGTLVDDLRAAATTGRPAAGGAGKRAAILLSSGDNFLAGPELAASMDDGAPFFDALAIRAMDYDASAIGNHEFDFGPEFLAEFINAFDGTLPFVSANLDFSAEPSLAELTEDGTIVSRTVVKKRGEQIGIVGLTTPTLPTISSPRNVEVLTDLAGITQAQVDALEASGVNKIILISHLQDINEERALVPNVSGVDLVIGGGGGELLADADDPLIPGDVAFDEYPLIESDADGNDVPVVTTSGNWAYVGKLVVHFDRAGNLLGHDEGASGPVRVSGVGDDAVEPDPQILAQVVEPVTAFVAELDATVVADSQVALDGVRNSVRSGETNLGNLLADALVWEATQQAPVFGTPVPDVGIQNAGGIRNDSVIPAGEVTRLDTFDIAPFSNFVSVIPEVPRDTFLRLLERGVSAATSPAGQFIQISGASFTYDPAQQAQVVDAAGNILVDGQRVQSVVLDDGTEIVQNGVVVPGEPIAVATNDFSARGGDAYPLGGLDFTPVGKTYQQALQEYLEIALGGLVTSAQYPEGGEGRITTLP